MLVPLRYTVVLDWEYLDSLPYQQYSARISCVLKCRNKE